MKKAVVIILGLVFLFPCLAIAKIGVGVGTGKIVLDQPAKPGLIYSLPVFVVINTGDEPSEYEVSIQHRENQPELKPPKDWFSFEPAQFYLEAGQTQSVQTKLSLPVRGASPGDYFAFLSAHPVIKKSEGGATSIGVAAASKLYFTVAPANFFSGIYYRAVSLFKLYSPWSYVVSAIIIAALAVLLFRRFFSLNFGVSLKKK
jgi:hypothetical protein